MHESPGVKQLYHSMKRSSRCNLLVSFGRAEALSSLLKGRDDLVLD